MSAFSFSRIVVGLDASGASLTAAAAAAEVAGRVRAELHGVFIEDINLLRLAALPFTRELRLPSGSAREISAESLQADMQAQARRARHSLSAAAERSKASFTFEVRRGPVDQELLAATAESDLLVLGVGKASPSWTGRGAGSLGSTARAAIDRAEISVLLLPEGASGVGSVVVLYDGSPGADRALAAGARLAEAGVEDFTVLALGDTPEEAREREASARATLRALQGKAGHADQPGHGAQPGQPARVFRGRAEVRALCGVDLARVGAAARAVQEGLLVLPAGGPLLPPPEAEALEERGLLQMPLLLVR